MHTRTMRQPLRVVLPICAFSIFSFVCGAACAADDPAAAKTAPHIRSTNRLPLSFEVNRGQADARARFLARSHGLGLFLTDQGAVMTLTKTAHHEDHRLPGTQPQQDSSLSKTAQSLGLRYQFAGASKHPKIEALDPLPGHSNYFIGNDPKRWRTDIAQYQRVRYRDVYPGVNIVYYGEDGQLEFDIEAAPGADLAQVRLHVDGADSLSLDDNGNLQLHTALGMLIQSRPVVYQMIAGERREVSGDYVLRDIRRDRSAHEVAFRVADFDRRYALVLDPTFLVGNLIGGSGTDDGLGVAIDNANNTYITGDTNSPAFPTTIGAYQTTPAGTDTFITKIGADGSTLIYSALIGGNNNDTANGIGVDSGGNAYITGNTLSTNFPVVNALQPGKVAPDAAFVTALNAAGNGLIYSTYLGGNSLSDGSTIGYAIKADASGNAYVTGITYSTTVPVSAGAFQMTNAGSGDAFVIKLNPGGSQVYGTYIGGSGTDEGRSIAVDDEGEAYIAGDTTSANLNGVTPFALGPLGGGDMLIAELNATGTGLVYATEIGGSGLDEAIGIAVDGGHQVYFAAFSNSTDLPPATPPQANAGFYEAYIGHLDDSGTVLYDFASYGSSVQNSYGVAIDLDEARQSVYLTGYADGGMNTLPVINPVTGLDCANPNPFPACYTAGAFVMGYTPSLLTLMSATRVTAGNGTSTKFNAVAHDPATGNVVTVGSTSGNPPVTTTATNAGGDDVYSLQAAFEHEFPPLPPVVNKRFEPPTTVSGQSDNILTISVTNPNTGTDIRDFKLIDNMPSCIFLEQNLGSTCAGLTLQRSGETGALSLSVPVLNPGQTCLVTFKFQAFYSPACDNVTDAPTSSASPGKPAKAHLNIARRPGSTWHPAGARETNSDASASPMPTSSGSMSDSANWAEGAVPTSGNDIAFPDGVTQTSVTNDLPAGQAFNLVSMSGTGYDLDGMTFNLEAGFNNSGASNTVSAPIKAILPLVFTSDPATAGMNLSGGIDLNGNSLDFNGAGISEISGIISGAGDINGDGIGDVIINTSPTFAGNINIFGGAMYLNTSVSEPVEVFNGGYLRGTGPVSALTLDFDGTVFPGTGPLPATMSVGSLTVNDGSIQLSFDGSSNSSLSASGAVQLHGGTLLLRLVSAPTLGTVFPNLITTSATVTGCLAQATTPLPNVFVKPQCSSSAVSAIVDAVDGVFRNGFGG